MGRGHLALRERHHRIARGDPARRVVDVARRDRPAPGCLAPSEGGIAPFRTSPRIRVRWQSSRSEREHWSGKRLVKGVRRAFSDWLLASYVTDSARATGPGCLALSMFVTRPG